MSYIIQQSKLFGGNETKKHTSFTDFRKGRSCILVLFGLTQVLLDDYATQKIKEIVVFHNNIISGFEVTYDLSGKPITVLHGSKPALNQSIKRTAVTLSKSKSILTDLSSVPHFTDCFSYEDEELYAVSGITGLYRKLETNTKFVFRISFVIRDTKTGEFRIESSESRLLYWSGY